MPNYRRYRKSGFTLVEIMIVVAIIALIAAIAIPNMLRARVNANEASGIASVRTLVSSLESFRANQTPVTYPPDLPTLASANPPYIDGVLGAGTKQGYSFAYTRVNANQYTLTADPQTPNITGVRGFFANETGVIRVANPAPATAVSAPLE